MLLFLLKVTVLCEPPASGARVPGCKDCKNGDWLCCKHKGWWSRSSVLLAFASKANKTLDREWQHEARSDQQASKIMGNGWVFSFYRGTKVRAKNTKELPWQPPQPMQKAWQACEWFLSDSRRRTNNPQGDAVLFYTTILIAIGSIKIKKYCGGLACIFAG